MLKKTIEMTLQGSLFRHLGKDYSALVSDIETTWKEETTDLQDIILRVIRHAEINKGNNQDMAANISNPLAVNTQRERERVPRGTCTTPGGLIGAPPPTPKNDAGSYTRSSDRNTLCEA